MRNDSILYDIQTNITFEETKIEIDRSYLVQSLKREIEKLQVLIISGIGGVGKTAVIKKLYEEQQNTIPIYIFKGSEFDLNDINSLFKDTTLQDFIKICADEETKIVIIDSAEKLLDLKNKDGDKYWYIDKIVRSYLFAQTMWREEVTQWHTLKENNKIFFKKVTENIGHCPSVLYSISKLLNDIGSIYLDDGVIWISKMINKNRNLWSDELARDTVYYLEGLVKKYIFLNREKVRRTKQLKQEIIIILDFLIEKGSVIGYMLRENIL